jgi:hypothetical protein
MSEELKYRINQFEVSPPSGAWDNISATLDEWKEWEPVSARLQNAAITPPPGNWEQIEESLETPVVEIKRPVRKIGFAVYRVAASVIIVILLIWAGNGFNRRKKMLPEKICKTLLSVKTPYFPPFLPIFKKAQSVKR